VLLRVVLGVVVALAARDAAASCQAELADWTVLGGELAAGAACGTLVMTTDAGATRFYSGGEYWPFSVALPARREEVSVPNEVALEGERLTPEASWLVVRLPGVTVRITTRIVMFVGDPARQVADFHDEHDELAQPGYHQLIVRQTSSEVSVFYDGKLLEHRAVAAPPGGTIALGLLVVPGQRALIALHDVRIRPVTGSSAPAGRTNAASGTPAPAHRPARADAPAPSARRARPRPSADPT
jgi:hypothetical protein